MLFWQVKNPEKRREDLAWKAENFRCGNGGALIVQED
jgi:hypothetical protein